MVRIRFSLPILPANPFIQSRPINPADYLNILLVDPSCTAGDLTTWARVGATLVGEIVHIIGLHDVYTTSTSEVLVATYMHYHQANHALPQFSCMAFHLNRHIWILSYRQCRFVVQRCLGNITRGREYLQLQIVGAVEVRCDLLPQVRRGLTMGNLSSHVLKHVQ
jgi:hypothetical protein